jgi:hypothetical protein
MRDALNGRYGERPIRKSEWTIAECINIRD